MNDTPSNEELEELIPAAALEILEAEELARVLAHARESPECARVLKEYREVIAAMALGLPRQPLDPGRAARLRDRLLIRARNEPLATDRSRSAVRARSRWGGVDSWGGWAIAAGLAGVLLAHHGLHRPLAYGWVVAGLATLGLVVFGIYAVVQRRRVSALEDRLATLERDQDARLP